MIISGAYGAKISTVRESDDGGDERTAVARPATGEGAIPELRTTPVEIERPIRARRRALTLWRRIAIGVAGGLGLAVAAISIAIVADQHPSQAVESVSAPVAATTSVINTLPPTAIPQMLGYGPATTTTHPQSPPRATINPIGARS